MISTPENSRQYKIYRKGDPAQRKLALTFDDGPDTKWTPKILDALARKNVRATFFVLGRFVERNPDVLRRIAGEGHVIGNHSYSHANLTRLGPNQMVNEIQRGAGAVAAVIGRTPRLLRPPYGAYNQRVLETATNLGNYVIMWSVDPQDWRGLSSAAVAGRVINAAQNGDIIILHSGEGPNLQGTVDALPIIIDSLRRKGFSFVTVPELLGLPGYYQG